MTSTVLPASQSCVGTGQVDPSHTQVCKRRWQGAEIQTGAEVRHWVQVRGRSGSHSTKEASGRKDGWRTCQGQEQCVQYTETRPNAWGSKRHLQRRAGDEAAEQGEARGPGSMSKAPPGSLEDSDPSHRLQGTDQGLWVLGVGRVCRHSSADSSPPSILQKPLLSPFHSIVKA